MKFFQLFSLFLLATQAPLVASEYAVTFPITGTSQLTQTKAFDQELIKLMVSSHIPGATAALIKNNQLQLNRAYGYADLEKQLWMRPDHALRIGSVSKTITCITLCHLLQETKHSLDTPFLSLLEQKAPAPYQEITLRHLLQMTSGWYEDRPEDYDIALGPWSQAMLEAMQVPPKSQEALQYMLCVPLDFPPGTQYSYSNFSYNTLGLVIAKLANCPYEDYVQKEILRPLNLHQCKIGDTQAPSDHSQEPKYYVFADLEFRHMIDRMADGLPYGSTEFLKKNGAAAGWVATSQNLVTLLNTYASCKIVTNPPLQPYTFDDKQKAFGFDEVFEHNGVKYYLKTGSFSGTQAVVIMGQNGDSFALLFNAKPKTKANFLSKIKELFKMFA